LQRHFKMHQFLRGLAQSGDAALGMQRPGAAAFTDFGFAPRRARALFVADLVVACRSVAAKLDWRPFRLRFVPENVPAGRRTVPLDCRAGAAWNTVS
jgi:hypothetical protein